MITYFSVSLLAATLLTGWIRRYAIRRSLLDIPNQRSSHDQPVPRGGGLAIVLIVLGAVLISGVSGLLEQHQMFALLGGGGLVALVGWIDDHRDISALFRASVHLLAAIWTLYWQGGYHSLDLGFVTLELGWSGSILAALGMVWLINLYNFMDGTDGIAATEAITVGGFALILFIPAGNTGLVLIILSMLGATTGFLLWNWSPARIFMGDAGSGFLGYLFATLAIMGEKSASMPLLIWSILLSLFFWDATLTLIRRFRTGEKWYAAHRSHAYQRFVQMGISHEKLALCILTINIVILWPLAWIAMNYRSSLLVMALISAIMSAGLWLAIQRKYDKQKR